MATGIFGSVRSSDVSVDDIEIFYTYAPDRETISNEVFRFANPSDIISDVKLPTDDDLTVSGGENILEGLYNLTLPASVFSELGFYTLYIRPKAIKINISDCGVLSALPNVKGLLLDSTQLDADLAANNALQGYKIEYINSDGTKLRNIVRYVVTSNKVIPVTENIGNTSQSAVRYRFDDSGTLLFLQLTPSSASNVKPNVTPFIGNPNQTIVLSNTYFNPISLEIELVENDINTVVDIVGGQQIKDVSTGVFTNFDENGNILRQFNLFEVKDSVTNVPLYEVKERRSNIDETQNFNDIIDDL